MVNVEVRLFATLREYLPTGSAGGSTHLEVLEGASIADALKQLGIPAGKVHLLLVDGVYEANRDRILQEDETLSLWPPVAGG